MLKLRDVKGFFLNIQFLINICISISFFISSLFFYYIVHGNRIEFHLNFLTD